MMLALSYPWGRKRGNVITTPEPHSRVDVLFLCADPVWPVRGGFSARVFALTDFLRSEGFSVGLVVLNHGGERNAEIARRADAVWFYRGGGVAARNAIDRAPQLVQRAARAVRNAPKQARQAGRTLRRELRMAIPEPVRAAVFRPLRARLTGHAQGRPQPAPAQTATTVAPPAPAPEASFLARKVSPAFDAFAREVAITSGARVVVAEFAWTAGALEGLPPGILRVVDTHDVQHLRRASALEANHDMPDRDCTREEEIAALAPADMLLAIQAGEAEILKEMLPGKQVLLAEHALGGAPWLRGPADSQDLLYVGNLYPPNVAGAVAFLDTVWPALRARVPGARLVVCGKMCEALSGRNDPGLVLEGLVPSLDVYYQRAAVVVNLVPYGTGLKIKTVEALAHGKCTVVTPAGAVGLSPRPEAGLTVCAMEEMTDVLARLLTDPAARAAEEEAAWAFAQARLSPKAVYGAFAQAIKEHLKK